jgi:microcystin-dependent protein
MALIGSDYTTGDGLTLGVSLVLLEIPNEAWIKQVLISAFNTLTIEENWNDDYGAITADQATRVMSLMLQTLQFDYEPPPMTPIGGIMEFAGTVAPAGWLLCEGQAVSRSAYSDLFDLVGLTYGIGDGVTTFNVPNFIERSPMGIGGATPIGLGQDHGSLAVALTLDQMPNHDHDFADGGHNHTVALRASGVAGGAVNRIVAPTNTTLASNAQVDTNTANLTFHAQGSNSTHDNLHPVLGINFIIYTGV